MLRTAPLRVDVPGLQPRIVATADALIVLVIEDVIATPQGLRRPRRLDMFDWDGRPRWSRAAGQGHDGPRVDAAAMIWVAEPRALIGFDASGDVRERVEVSLDAGEYVAAFVPRANGFIVAAARGHRRATGRVLRLDRRGSTLWSTDVSPGAIAYAGVVEARADQGWRVTEKPAWKPESWDPVHREPLLVAGDVVLVGYHEFPRSGIGQRWILDLADGTIRWASSPGPWSHAAIAGDGAFLIGQQGYGAFRTDLVTNAGIASSWESHGHYLVTDASTRVVEMENVSTAKLYTATLGPGGVVTRGDRLPGYYTGGPLAFADGSIFMWRGGQLLCVDLDGRIVGRTDHGHEKAAAGRAVTDGSGRVAMAVSDGEYGRGPWPLWIFSTELPGLARGVWPCDGSGAGDVPIMGVR